jgi:hypothetical protein
MEVRKQLAGDKPADLAEPGPTREVGAKVAEILWQNAGRPKGRDREFWLLAKAILKGVNEAPHHEIKSK